jgi:hypothetical protein
MRKLDRAAKEHEVGVPIIRMLRVVAVKESELSLPDYAAQLLVLFRKT